MVVFCGCTRLQLFGKGEWIFGGQWDRSLQRPLSHVPLLIRQPSSPFTCCFAKQQYLELNLSKGNSSNNSTSWLPSCFLTRVMHILCKRFDKNNYRVWHQHCIYSCLLITKMYFTNEGGWVQFNYFINFKNNSPFDNTAKKKNRMSTRLLPYFLR